MNEQLIQWQRAKREIRAQARIDRQKQANRERVSRQIFRNLVAQPEYIHADVVMFYVDMGSEVRTRKFLPAVWKDGKRIVVPYCQDEQLALFYLESLGELAPGTLGILEPKAELRERADRRADVSRLDLIVVPGLAFDRRGGRLGQGKGYYDRLLRQAHTETSMIALAFECQLLPEVPMLPHDVYMQKVITEEAVYC